MTSENFTNSPSTEEIQTALPGYDRIDLIATGGMGAVYKARQMSLDRMVAIKVLTHKSSSTPAFHQFFKSEAQAMAILNHQNIASIYDYGETDGMLYIVMQYIEGRSLHAVAHGRAVVPHEAATLVSKVSNALSSAHKLGIVHRDIKPANIIIDTKINPVVVDFGLAHHSNKSTIQEGMVYGTQGYTAPEVFSPPYEASQQSDLFSLGVILHELLTGQMPSFPYLPPSHFITLDPRYDSVVMRAIHPNTEMRHPTTEQLSSDLDKIIKGKALSTSPLLSNY